MSMRGRVLNDQSSDPNYGLAIDHAILILNPSSEYFATIRFWSNPSSVILGRGQKLSEEINQAFCRDNQIQIARRITGGGAVYHDEGNLNISLLLPKTALENPDDIKETTSRLTNLLKESLKASGVENIRVDDTNSLLYQNCKVSGAAAYFTKETILHHSTLLLAVDLEKLEGSLIHHLEPERGRSRYKPTTNLTNLQAEIWKKKYVELISNAFDVSFQQGVITPEETALATKLRESLYCKLSWIVSGERPINL
jgi:lipoate-protein ligase A